MKTWMLLPTILPVLNDFWNKPGTVPGMTQMDCLEKDGLGHPFLCRPSVGGRLKIAPCIFRTPHIHVGRMSQRVRDGGATIGNLLSGKTLFVFNFRNLVG